MNVLITGGAGYIGSRLCSYLYNCGGFGITIIDNLMYDQGPLVWSVLEQVKFIKGDVTRLSEHKDIIESANVIIHLAAIVGAPACDRNPELATAVNLDSVKALVALLRPDQHLIFPNTNSGYGSTGAKICTEETPLNAISLYGKLKDEAEQIVCTHPNHTIFRLATVFGYSPRHRLDLLVNTLVYEAMTFGEVSLFDDSFMRNYIHVTDVCLAILWSITNPRCKNQIFNAGNDGLNMSKADLIKEIAKQLTFTVKKLDGVTDPDKRDYIVSSEKLWKTGWNPRINLHDGIAELMEYYSILPDYAKAKYRMTNV
jgi:nucleoside-diphosphate-sugar epimerase